MNKIAVLTAVTGAPWEAALVTLLDSSPAVDVVRRCVDIADLVATAASGQARAVLLSADLRRLDLDIVSRLTVAGVGVVGVIAPGDESAERRLLTLGVTHIVPADTTAAAVTATLLDAVERTGRTPSPPAAYSAPARPERATPAQEAVHQSGSGRLVAVWGPTGAPGRTFLAVNLAAEAAALGTETLLADADTYGGVVSQVLGLLDESPGLAAAARAATSGQLDVPTLARHARQVGPHLRVLTGIARAERWPELRSAALEAVWRAARALAALTIVDCGFSLEQDEELSYDTAAPRRNAATLATLTQADTVFVVGSADPVGLQRLVRGLAELDVLLPKGDVRVVVNRVRRSAVGASPEQQITAALRRYAGVRPVAFVPEDQSAADAAVLKAATLAEAAPRSSARQALAAITADLLGVGPARPRVRGVARPLSGRARPALRPVG